MRPSIPEKSAPEKAFCIPRVDSAALSSKLDLYVHLGRLSDISLGASCFKRADRLSVVNAWSAVSRSA